MNLQFELKGVCNVSVLRVSDVDDSPHNPCSVNITPQTSPLTTPVSWKSQHLPHNWPVDYSECLERSDRNQSARPTFCTLSPILQCQHIVTQSGVSVSFVRSLTPDPRPPIGCSSVSGSPSDISWYFLPTPRHPQVALQSFTFLQV